MIVAVPILLVLLVIALTIAAVTIAVALVAVVGSGISVMVGGIAALFRPTRVAAPIFLFIVPMTAMGGVLGATVIGGLIIASSSGVIVILGPVIGLAVGILIGGALGVTSAAITWGYLARAAPAK